MSNFLAIGAATALLKDHLVERLEQQQVSGTLDADRVSVGALPLDLIEKQTDGKPWLNLFLHQVSPNASWSNVGFPSFDGRGMRVGNPPLALDLHYLLTAHGGQDLHAEILLGCAMQLLHDTPVLTRADIREKQQKWLEPGADQLLKRLATTGLSDQAEQIKITLESMNPEEMSRLWTAFQAHYRPTAAYRVTVVLIETEHARKNVLPVLTLGPADRGVFVQPNLTPPTPTLTAVTLPNKQVSAQLDDDLTLEGHRLDGITLMDEAAEVTVDSDIIVRFFDLDPSRQRVLEVKPQSGNTSTQMTVRLRDASEPGVPNMVPEKRWAAGFYSVSVLFRRPGETSGRTTNELPLSLAPKVLNVEADRETDDKITFTAKVKPEVRWDQRASLLVGSIEIPAKADAIKDAAEAVAKAAEKEAKKNDSTKESVKDAARKEAEAIKDAAKKVADAAEEEIANNINATGQSVKQAARTKANEIKAQNPSQGVKDGAEAVAKAAKEQPDNAPPNSVKDAARKEAEAIKDAAKKVADAAEEEANKNDSTRDDVKQVARYQAGQTDTLTFGPRSIDQGDYFVRLRIDNVESLLIDRAATPPAFDQSQRVRIP